MACPPNDSAPRLDQYRFEQEIAIMIPHDIDPSLHTSEPMLESLDDGFSPPDQDEFAPDDDPHLELALGEQSQF